MSVPTLNRARDDYEGRLSSNHILERAGADALIARDKQTAISRLLNLDVSAALVGQGHHNVAKHVHKLGMPVIRYQSAHAQVEPLVRAVREAIRLSRR